jgi:DNA-binding response OmpR family regulator
MLPVVLLVEDDPLLFRAYSRALRSPHYDLELAQTPASALAEALTVGDRLKLLITDQNLNGKGEDLARDLRRRLPNLQVLILTGGDWESDEFEVLQKTGGLQALRTKVLEKLGVTRFS